KGFLGAAYSVFVLIAVSMITLGNGAADRVTGAIVLLASGWVLFRLARVQVRISTSHLLIRSWWRSRRLSWDEVVGAEVIPANPMSRLFAILMVRLRDGGRVKVDGIGNWMRRRERDALPVAQMAAAINDRASGRP